MITRKVTRVHLVLTKTYQPIIFRSGLQLFSGKLPDQEFRAALRNLWLSASKAIECMRFCNVTIPIRR